MNRITFHDVVDFARFCCELTRQGMAYHATQTSSEFVVIITGY